MYPKDYQYQEHVIKKVDKDQNGFVITDEDGWSLFIKPTVEPKIGAKARFYGRGIGTPVRGVYISGKKVFYRTEAEDAVYQKELSYGKNIEEWLARWDNGENVFSVEMGGFGPGYEQAIQVTAVTLIRYMLKKGYDASSWIDNDKWKKDQDEIRAFSFKDKTIKSLGLSGAQFGAALQLASTMYMKGPIETMAMVKDDRVIQISNNFPQEVKDVQNP